MTYISPPGLEFWPIPISEQVWTDVLCIHSWDLDPDCGCGVGDHWVRSSRLPSGTSWECQRNVGLQWKILSKMDDLGVPESPKCWSNFQYISNLSDLSKSLNWPSSERQLMSWIPPPVPHHYLAQTLEPVGWWQTIRQDSEELGIQPLHWRTTTLLYFIILW